MKTNLALVLMLAILLTNCKKEETIEIHQNTENTPSNNETDFSIIGKWKQVSNIQIDTLNNDTTLNNEDARIYSIENTN